MKNRILSKATLCSAGFACLLVPQLADAKRKPKAPVYELTEQGKTLEQKYAAQLEALREELMSSLPKVSKGDKNAFSAAREAEIKAKADQEKAKSQAGQIGKAQGLVAHAKGKWIGGAEKGIASTKQKLAKAKTPEEKKAAQKELETWQKNLKAGQKALVERQAKLDQLIKEKADLEKAKAKAIANFEDAKKASADALKNLGLSSFLSSSKLDEKLAKFVVMNNATAKGLANYAQKSAKHKASIDSLLKSGPLLVQMVVADGAKDHNYGAAMSIYQSIQASSKKLDKPTLQRLALAISLEHATPIKQRNAEAATDAPAFVDPVKRYLHYEAAFLNGELDPVFKDLSTWDYRMVVDGSEPDETLAWGREMLRNYRPDHILTSDFRWRYVATVRSDIRYGSQDNKFDKEELQFFQNILMNGGICGRRAFFGRFILRAFGIPTTARPQRGHAALVHWTPDGWVVCLGGGWGAGWTKTRYGTDLDFLANTQARYTGDTFKQVKRAQWIGDLMGEPKVFGLNAKQKPEFWYSVSLITQKAIIKAADSKTLAAVGEDIGEANETKEKVEIVETKLSKKDLTVSIDSKGGILIPAVATSTPTKSTGKILFMDSYLGGKQMHYSRTGNAQKFEYTFDVPSSGKYQLKAKVVTPSWRQSMQLTVNNAAEAINIALPFTVGMWDYTDPVTVDLKAGTNKLSFIRDHEGLKGCTIKEFTLTPVK